MSNDTTKDVTQLLASWREGHQGALDKLVAVVYDELNQISRKLMQRERSGHTLQTAGLVNEAYLHMLKLRYIEWRDRRHFLAVAAGVMRRVLVDHARASSALKRGGAALRVTQDNNMSLEQDCVGVLELDTALQRLAKRDEVQSRIVELRYFGGLTVEETAEALAISPATIKRKWTIAKAWLFRELRSDG